MKKIKITSLLLLFYLICLGSAQAQIELVQDINVTSEVEDLRIQEQLTLANGKIIISYANHPAYGVELWTLNDSDEPVLLIDINPGIASSYPENLTMFGDKVIFSAKWSPGEGYSPSITDGTEEGTFALLTLPEDKSVYGFARLNATEFLFQVAGNGNPVELWKTDGTVNGTTLITTLPDGMLVTGLSSALDKVFFSGTTESLGRELWVTDGTEAGTSLVKDIVEADNSSSPSKITEFNGHIYFRARTIAEGNELWKSDGTEEGTVLVKDIQPGTEDGIPSSTTLIVLDNKLYFTADDGVVGTELWVSDGTEEGTELLKDIRDSGSSLADEFFVFNDLLLFSAYGADSQELWKTDGTEEGTVQVKDINPGGAGSSSSLFTFFNNKVYFSASSDTEEGLWVTDGTEEGTELAAAIDFGVSTRLRDIKASSERIYIATQQDGPQLFVSDGTSEGTTGISNEVTFFNSSEPQNFEPIAGGVLFTASISEEESSLFYSDGSTITNLLPTDTYIQNSSSNDDMIKAGTKFFFQATTDEEGDELWVTDGTVEGTLLLKDINPGSSNSNTQEFVVFGDKVIFQANDGTAGSEPWITDGTAEGTTMIKDIRTGSDTSNPRDFTVVNDKCYFTAFDGSTGYELFVTDGTEIGTQQIIDLDPGNSGALRIEFVFNNKMVIYGTDDRDTYGNEMVISDGTAEGTQRITDINPGTGNLDFRDFLTFDEYFTFIARIDGARALWKSDGTAEGTTMLADGFQNVVIEGSVGESAIYFAEDENDQDNLLATNTVSGTTTILIEDIQLILGGEGGLNDANAAFINGKLLITNGIFENEDSPTPGSAIWVTDGTVAGTEELTMDAYNNPIAPIRLFTVGSDVFFNGYNTETNTYSLWHTDGTKCGTLSLNDDPVDIFGDLTPANGYLYFRGFTANLGSELYRYDLSSDIPDLRMTWYRDADGDGLGDPNNVVEDCEQPEGYVSNTDDCDDTDASVSQYTWYRDADGDGLGNESETTEACEQPEGYVDNTDDCDDTDADVSQYTWYRDADGDGLGNESETTEACEQPEGYVENANDCDDTDSANQCALGIEDPMVKVYPNPSNDFIHIESREARSVRLIDLNGKTIMSTSGKQLQIDIQRLKPGTYLLKVAGEKTESIHRIIKAN